MTDTDGSVTSYDYDDEGRLVKQYSANSTDDKPLFTEYQYSDRLAKAVNAKKKRTTTAMTRTKTLLMTQPNAKCSTAIMRRATRFR